MAEAVGQIEQLVDALPARVAAGEVSSADVMYDNSQLLSTLKQVQHLDDKSDYFQVYLSVRLSASECVWQCLRILSIVHCSAL